MHVGRIRLQLVAELEGATRFLLYLVMQAHYASEEKG